METQTLSLPPLIHQELQELYRHGLRIDHELLRTILALPRETLVKDLELILTDI